MNFPFTRPLRVLEAPRRNGMKELEQIDEYDVVVASTDLLKRGFAFIIWRYVRLR